MKSPTFSSWLSALNAAGQTGLFTGHTSIHLAKKKYWHPLMAEFLLGIRYKTAILNPHLVRKNILRAFFMMSLVLKNNGHILVVNTHPEYAHLTRNVSYVTLQKSSQRDTIHASIVKNYAHLSTGNISYCCSKWVGGMLTNWKQVSKSVLTFAKFSERCESFLAKNNIEFPRYKKVKTCFQGLVAKNLQGQTTLAFEEKPDLIFLLNPNENQNVIMEATKLHIPIVACVESNTNLRGITYPIPATSSSISFIYYCLKKLLVLAGTVPQKKGAVSTSTPFLRK